MLHGYTQSGDKFHAKTRALEKALIKAFPASSASPIPSYPGGIQLFYPTGPLRLNPADIPGYDPSNPGAVAENAEIDAYGWWRREVSTGEYEGLLDGLKIMAETIKEAGGIDGVIGFSQGAAASAMVASLLDEGRARAFEETRKEKGGIGYPSSFLGADSTPINPPLKFAVSYAGFMAPNPLYQAFYEPKIETPSLHFIGSLDTAVEEKRPLALIERCSNSRVIYHPGGHFVPIAKEFAAGLISFIRETCGQAPKEESVEDMDVPF